MTWLVSLLGTSRVLAGALRGLERLVAWSTSWPGAHGGPERLVA